MSADHLKSDASNEVYIFPATYAQERLWFFEKSYPQSDVYHIPLIFRVQGFVDPLLLQKSLDTIVERHESLRTCFIEENHQLMQVIYSSVEIPVKTVDLTGNNPGRSCVVSDGSR
jgi:hypothetical protein